MFRIGSLLFIPAYLSVTLYHPLAGAENSGGFILMTGECDYAMTNTKECD